MKDAPMTEIETQSFLRTAKALVSDEERMDLIAYLAEIRLPVTSWKGRAASERFGGREEAGQEWRIPRHLLLLL